MVMYSPKENCFWCCWNLKWFICYSAVRHCDAISWLVISWIPSNYEVHSRRRRVAYWIFDRVKSKEYIHYTTVHQLEEKERVDYEHWSLLLPLSSSLSSLEISIRFKLIHSFFLLIFSPHKIHLAISMSHFSILEFFSRIFSSFLSLYFLSFCSPLLFILSFFFL